MPQVLLRLILQPQIMLTDLAQTLVGTGVTISNPTLNCGAAPLAVPTMPAGFSTQHLPVT